MKRKKVFPDFFILGAAKCGTTSLYAYLDQHQDIYMSKPKEPLFFEAEFEKGLDFYWEKYFSGWKGEKLVADSRHRNLYLPYVAERIHAVNPDARFIILLRNPIDRAQSHWWHYYRRGYEQLDFEEAVKADLERIGRGLFNTPEIIGEYADESGKEVSGRKLIRYRTYLDTGYYAEQIECYLKLFPSTSFKFVLFKDMIKDPIQVVTDVCEFLAIDSDECARFDYSARNKGKHLKVRTYTASNLMKNFLYASRTGSIFDSLSNIRNKPKIDSTLHEWLAEHFRPHNKRLEGIIGRNLDHWV
ncbi:MAG: sulfotransferase [Deltaproteobacteria bacterium]|nr:sulfotransferase [Deltaproteobacteria bacterium]